MIKHLLSLTCCVLMNMVVQAQEIQLVKDINLATSSSRLSIENRRVVNGKIFFLAYDQSYGNELFVTDGTSAGTMRLTDNDEGEDEPKALTSGNGYAYFKAWRNDSYYLFRSDGTKQGTFPLRKLSRSFYDESTLLDLNGTMYFSGHDDRGRLQLWKTDGTIAGTSLVKDLGPRGNYGQMQDFTIFKGKLFFIVRPNIYEDGITTIWSSDGTEAGTVAGATYTEGANSNHNFLPTKAGDYMYFTDSDVIYKTDGKSITVLSSELTEVSYLNTIGTKIYFRTGNDEEEEQKLYSMNTDGTSITALTTGLTNLSFPRAVGTEIYFKAYDTVHGTELWKTNGTVAGTVLVKDIFPGNIGSDPEELTNLNGTVYFSARVGTSSEIWKSDGTAAGTTQVTNLNSTTRVYTISDILLAGNNLVFKDNYSESEGRLWKTDGTAAGTTLLVDFEADNAVILGNSVIYEGRSPTLGEGLFRTDLSTGGTELMTRTFNQSSFPNNLTDADGTLYFGTYFTNDSLSGLWKSDGTTAGTVPVQQIGNYLTKIVAGNGKIYYRNGELVFRTDGTNGNAVQVSPRPGNEFNEGLESFTIVDNTVYSVVRSASSRLQLWKGEGNPAVTTLIKTFAVSDDLPFEPVAFKGQLYFGIYNGGLKIWKSNGTEAGTQIAPEFASTGSLITSYEGTTFRVMGGSLYGFFTSSSGTKLIKTDGTPAGTTTVASIPFSPASLFEAGGLIYMTSATSGDEKKLLWRTDGTASGTFQLAVLDVKLVYNEELGRPADPFRLQTDVNGKLFFMNTNTAQGDHLWVSDGTVAGTRRVTRVPQKQVSFFTQHAESLGGLFYFNYYEPVTGGELWQSDGTPEGTHVVQDFTPGGNTDIREMKRINNILMISAFTESTGYELYKFVPAPIEPSLRINAGGAAFTASGGRTFSADQYFTGTTQVSNAAAGDIAGTTDDQLYKEQRFGSSFSYNIPVSSGTYNVRLYFAEIYWGVPARSGTTGTARRSFHVNMEGTRKLTDYDIFAKAGGAMRAKTETFSISVTDGTLNIDFLKGAADNPIIAAIEVVPTQVILGPLADAYIRNTPHEAANFGTAGTLEVKTGSLPSYQRGTYLKFPLGGVSQVGSAKLRLYGSNVQNNTSTSLAAYGVSDDSWTETGITWSNAPAGSSAALGSVSVNSTAGYYEIDVSAFVKTELAGDKTVSFFITNPADQNSRLTFNSRENAANPPQLVIESVSVPATRIGSDETVTALPDPDVSGIFPNPVTGKHLFIKVSARHKSDVLLNLINISGQSILTQKKSYGKSSIVDIDVSASHIPAGMYLLHIESKAHKEVLKMIVTD